MLGYAMAAAMATASARRKAVLRPRCQPGEKKCVCSSSGSLYFSVPYFQECPPVPPARWMGSFMMTGTTSVPLWDAPSRASSQDQHIVAAGVQYNWVGRERRGRLAAHSYTFKNRKREMQRDRDRQRERDII